MQSSTEESQQFEGAKYEFLEKLGQGGQAVVYSAVLKSKNNQSDHKLSPYNINPNEAGRKRLGTTDKYFIEGIYAAKIITKFSITKDGPETAEKRKKALNLEIFVMNEINSPYVIRVHEFLENKDRYIIIQELSNGLSLIELINHRMSN